MISERNILFVLFIIVSILLPGCGGTYKNDNAKKAEDYVWPLPPEQPRIQYVGSVHSEMDVGIKKSGSQKIFELFFGRAALRYLRKPLTVHVDDKERMYVVDTGVTGVWVFDFDNHKLEALGGRGRGHLKNPLAVTSDSKCNIYVTDAGGGRIMVYDSTFAFVRAFGGKNILKRPTGIALNEALNRAYVTDTWMHQIKIFNTKTGEVIKTIGRDEPEPETEKTEGVLDEIQNRGSDEGELSFPTYITIAKNGDIYVVDMMNFRVQIFNGDGEFQGAFGEVGNLPGNLYRPKGIGLDSDGHVYVADASFSNIQIFQNDGTLLLNFGTFGAGLADLRLPAGVFVSKKDKIYVVDQYNHRVQIYQYLKPVTIEEETITTKRGG
ncbi:MAG: hypothetical protein DWQ05_05830 [Calditrichaeota bacterium]|nr:MAG: hypothetical protein DWQ05_05830 [Calditrichota bacterium]